MDSLDAFGMCAVRAAVEGTLDLDAVTDDSTAAVLAGGSQLRDRAFKAIEGIILAAHNDLEGLVIFVAALLALSHLSPPSRRAWGWPARMELEPCRHGHDDLAQIGGFPAIVARHPKLTHVAIITDIRHLLGIARRPGVPGDRGDLCNRCLGQMRQVHM